MVIVRQRQSAYYLFLSYFLYLGLSILVNPHFTLCIPVILFLTPHFYLTPLHVQPVVMSCWLSL